MQPTKLNILKNIGIGVAGSALLTLGTIGIYKTAETNFRDTSPEEVKDMFRNDDNLFNIISNPVGNNIYKIDFRNNTYRVNRKELRKLIKGIKNENKNGFLWFRFKVNKDTLDSGFLYDNISFEITGGEYNRSDSNLVEMDNSKINKVFPINPSQPNDPNFNNYSELVDTLNIKYPAYFDSLYNKGGVIYPIAEAKNYLFWHYIGREYLDIHISFKNVLNGETTHYFPTIIVSNVPNARNKLSRTNLAESSFGDNYGDFGQACCPP